MILPLRFLASPAQTVFFQDWRSGLFKGSTYSKTLRFVADRQKYTTPSTIKDPMFLDEIQEILRQKRNTDWNKSA